MENVAFKSLTKNPDFPDVADVSPDELANLTDKVAVIDVREPSEYTGELGHIRGSLLLSLGTLPDQIGTLPKDKPLVFVCRSGGRSARATAFALSHGLNHVYNMRGGMLLWNSLGLAVERE